MDGNQISEQRISGTFNSNANLSLKEKVEVLRKSLPPEKQAEHQSLQQKLAKETDGAQQRIESKRPDRMKNAYDAAHAQILQSAVRGKMPPPTKEVVEHNARLIASRNVQQKEGQERQNMRDTILNRELQFLKKWQPDHPLSKERQAAENTRTTAKENFNSASRQKEQGR